MALYPYPKLTDSGRFLLYTVGVVVCVVVMGALIISCNRRPVHAERPWGQGYETAQGSYMEPDHSWAYYYMMNRMLWQDARPTYHVYVPPPNHPTYYRPWRTDIPNTITYRSPRTAVTPARSSGGFAPSPVGTGGSAQTPARTTGGFSRPAAAPSPRSTGGFSQPPPAPARSTGGFSTPKPSSPPPTRSSGGFSKSSSSPPKSSPSRSSGGFSKKK
jgi:hypothetical protein